MTGGSNTFKTANSFYSYELVDTGIDQELAFDSFCKKNSTKESLFRATQ